MAARQQHVFLHGLKTYGAVREWIEGAERMSLREEQRIWLNLLATPEGRILAAGGILSLVSIAWLAVQCFWAPELSRALVMMTLTSIFFGRAAGLTVGYSMGMGHGFVVPFIMLVETILVLLFYPLFVFSYKRLLVIPKLKRMIDRTGRAAEAYSGKIRRYGMISLFVFVWSPFWMTGPVVGCAIGFLLGIRLLYNLSIVLVGTYLAIYCWALFLGEIKDRVAEHSSYAPLVLVAVVILVVLGGRLLHTVHHRKTV